MGTGKTTVGEKLAKAIGYSFEDTDTLIEKTYNKKVSAIFEAEGEEIFRNYEALALEHSLLKTPVVVATGGGIVLKPQNRQLMKEKGFVIALTSTPEKILERTQNEHHRPLLESSETDNRLQTIKTLLSKRTPYYLEADTLIDTTHLTPDEIVQEIMKVL